MVHVSVRHHRVECARRILCRELIADVFVPKIAQRLLRGGQSIGRISVVFICVSFLSFESVQFLLISAAPPLLLGIGQYLALVGSCIVRITDMRETHLRNVDLNLLLALHALLEERHVTRAAKRCFLSQSAMSRALERLREMFGDALLIRSGRAYERTVRGDSLLRELQSLLPRLESMVRGEEFDPARSQERFRLAVRHHASITLIPPLIRRIRTEAPDVRLEVSQWEERAYEAVMAGSLDAALSAEHPPSGLGE